jgi:hypothetical protein
MEMMNRIHSIIASDLALGVYIIIPLFIIIKGIRRRKFPSNSYTPVDDILEGKKRDEDQN